MTLDAVHDNPNLLNGLIKLCVFCEPPVEEKIICVCNQVLLQPLIGSVGRVHLPVNVCKNRKGSPLIKGCPAPLPDPFWRWVSRFVDHDG